MRKIAFLLLICLVNGSVQATPANPPANVPIPVPTPTPEPESVRDAKALTALIKKQLPPGWTVTYPVWGHDIVIERLKPTEISVRAWPGMSGMPLKPEPKPQKSKPLPRYTYFLQVVEFVDPADYRAWDACNRETEKRMREAVAGLQPGKGRYRARNADEARKVQRYERLEKSLHPLPDYYWGHISLEKLEIGGIPEYELVVDDKVRQECTQVTQAMLALLNAYDKPAPVVGSPTP